MNSPVDYDRRSVFYSLLTTFFVFLGFTASAHAEFIRTFDCNIKALKNATIDITETIKMDFENSPRHGIYRIIPVQYDRPHETYSTPLKVLEITDETGKSLNYSKTHQGNDITIKIGDPDITLTGVHVYKIHYTVMRAVTFPDNAPEVYWNATGDQWPYEIKNVTVHFHSPEGVTAEQIRTACYVGPPGSTAAGEIDAKNAADVVFSTAALPPGSGLTFVVGLPKGSMVKAGLWQQFWWWFSDWWPVVVFPLLAVGLMWTMWMAKGRDVSAGPAIAVEWNPPKDLSPAEVGTLVDESCDTPDIVSTVVDLAARGWFTIKEIKRDKLLFMGARDYLFTKNDPLPKTDRLAEHEKVFFSGLFAGKSNKVLLSELKYTFYPTVDSVRSMIYEQMVSKDFFTIRPDRVRGTYLGAGVAVVVLGVLLFYFGFESGHISWGIGTILAGIIIAALAKIMPAKTLAGTQAMRECLGFQRFMALVEKDRIQRMAKDDPTIFGRLLPYAMVLGVADQWAHAFDGMALQPPDWYQSNDPYDHFNAVYFSNRLNYGLGSMSQTMTSRPPSQSSGGSGSSGFSGGSSGGGFGGGGGGSW